MSMSYARIKPSFWTGKTGRALRGHPDAQALAVYLMSSPHANMIGAYRCPIAYMAAETGRPTEGASEALTKLCQMGFCTFDPETETVWVHEMARFQIDEALKLGDKRVKNVAKLFAEIENDRIKRAFFAKYGTAYHLVEPPILEANPPPSEAPSESDQRPSEASNTNSSSSNSNNTISSVPSERAPAAPRDENAELFARGREVLGKNAGGQIAKLLKAKGGMVNLARAAIEAAASKDKPGEYIAKAIAGGQGPPAFERGRPNGGFTEILLQHQEEQSNDSVTIDHDDSEFARH